MEEEAATRPSKKARRAAKKVTAKKACGAAGSGSTAFALRLAKHLADDEGAAVDGGGQNVVFSPLTIYAALALTAAGARGTTLDELLTVLGAASRDEIAEFVRGVAEHALADGSKSGAPLVAFACGLWHEKTVALSTAYRAAAVEYYKAETHAADFENKAEEAREDINRWVSKATKDLITSILPEGSVHSGTGLVLANAVYFKGSWSMPFASKDTETRRFHRLDGSHVSAPFMRGRKDQAVKEYDGFKVLKLAYRPFRLPHWQDRYGGRQRQRQRAGPRFSMCVFLPDAKDGLANLVDKMAASSLNFLWDHMPAERVEVRELWLPKFKLSFSSKMNGVLKAMGIEAAFKEAAADFCDMLEDRGRSQGVHLVLEHVFHRAFIEVNEEGTEAAASTTSCSRKLQCARKPMNFVADHPFAFFVVEVSRVVVFMGHVLDPTKSE